MSLPPPPLSPLPRRVQSAPPSPIAVVVASSPSSPRGGFSTAYNSESERVMTVTEQQQQERQQQSEEASPKEDGSQPGSELRLSLAELDAPTTPCRRRVSQSPRTQSSSRKGRRSRKRNEEPCSSPLSFAASQTSTPLSLTQCRKRRKYTATPTSNAKPKPTLPSASYCCICMQDAADHHQLAKVNGCLHHFCFDCIAEWSKVENSCPLCKNRFTQIIRIPPRHRNSNRTRGQASDPEQHDPMTNKDKNESQETSPCPDHSDEMKDPEPDILFVEERHQEQEHHHAVMVSLLATRELEAPHDPSFWTRILAQFAPLFGLALSSEGSEG